MGVELRVLGSASGMVELCDRKIVSETKPLIVELLPMPEASTAIGFESF